MLLEWVNEEERLDRRSVYDKASTSEKKMADLLRCEPADITTKTLQKRRWRARLLELMLRFDYVRPDFKRLGTKLGFNVKLQIEKIRTKWPVAVLSHEQLAVACFQGLKEFETLPGNRKPYVHSALKRIKFFCGHRAHWVELLATRNLSVVKYSKISSLTCTQCSNTFKTTINPSTIMGIICRICSPNMSVGATDVLNTLVEYNISFELEKSYDDLRAKKTGALLRYDFYLPDYNMFIEYDGEDHYKPRYYSSILKEEAERLFNEGITRDNQKNRYAKKHKITLLRIPYWEKNVRDVVIKSLNIIT